MKYKDNHQHKNKNKNNFGVSDKYGNVKSSQERMCEIYDKKRRRDENRNKRSFVKLMYAIDKHWVMTLEESEMSILYSSWSFNEALRKDIGNYTWHNGDIDDGSHESLEDFIKLKKKIYGNVREARDLKIEELFQD